MKCQQNEIIFKLMDMTVCLHAYAYAYALWLHNHGYMDTFANETNVQNNIVIHLSDANEPKLFF